MLERRFELSIFLALNANDASLNFKGFNAPLWRLIISYSPHITPEGPDTRFKNSAQARSVSSFTYFWSRPSPRGILNTKALRISDVCLSFTLITESNRRAECVVSSGWQIITQLRWWFKPQPGILWVTEAAGLQVAAAEVQSMYVHVCVRKVGDVSASPTLSENISRGFLIALLFCFSSEAPSAACWSAGSALHHLDTQLLKTRDCCSCSMLRQPRSVETTFWLYWMFSSVTICAAFTVCANLPSLQEIWSQSALLFLSCSVGKWPEKCFLQNMIRIHTIKWHLHLRSHKNWIPELWPKHFFGRSKRLWPLIAKI